MQWISVKDRLPEKSGRYLICYNLKGRAVVRLISFDDRDNPSGTKSKRNWKIFGYISQKNITHWSELPETPY